MSGLMFGVYRVGKIVSNYLRGLGLTVRGLGLGIMFWVRGLGLRGVGLGVWCWKMYMEMDIGMCLDIRTGSWD